MTMKSQMLFTMDVEEWSHAENLAKYDLDASHSSVKFVYDVLDLLDKKAAKGTFFVLGVVALKNAMLIKEIAGRGHELASHGYDHTLINTLSVDQLTTDVSSTKKILEDLGQRACVGYRSPCFSYHPALDSILLDTGHKYKSCSMNASVHDRYSMNRHTSDEIPDFALPHTEFFNLNIPSSGGGYFRLFPIALQDFLVRASNITPRIFYCHPWDFDATQPLPANLPILTRLRHTIGSKAAMRKLEKFNFGDQTLVDLL